MRNRSLLVTIHHQQKPTSKKKKKIDMGYCEETTTSSAYGCGCFQICCFRRSLHNHNAYKYLLQQQEEYNKETNWWRKKVKRVKEISEVLAGPKWKTFIGRSSTSYGTNKFQYDLHSYALNFDGGVDQDIDGSHPDFLARFAAPSGAKTGELVRLLCKF